MRGGEHMKHYQDESILHSYKRQMMERENALEDNSTLEDKLNLIRNNFEESDNKFGEYSALKLKLNNGRLFLGEFTKYQKEVIKIKNEMFDLFKISWSNLIKYNNDLPPKTFNMYRARYKIYNYDIKRNTFNVTIFDKYH